MVAWPLLVFVGLVVVLVAGMMVLSYLLGQRSPDREQEHPYESGIEPLRRTGSGMTVSFYRIAVFFVIFDVEAVFILAWAVALRDLGWSGYVQMLVFVAVLLAALVYLWRLGSLDVRRGRRKSRGA